MPSNDRTCFLFDPASVLDTLKSFPYLAAELDPENEGTKAESFARLRKSPRQIYRVLGNTHYEHLTELLEALDTCIAHGFRQPRLLSTRAGARSLPSSPNSALP